MEDSNVKKTYIGNEIYFLTETVEMSKSKIVQMTIDFFENRCSKYPLHMTHQCAKESSVAFHFNYSFSNSNFSLPRII